MDCPCRKCHLGREDKRRLQECIDCNDRYQFVVWVERGSGEIDMPPTVYNPLMNSIPIEIERKFNYDC
jgi:hypothetical protein